MNTRNALTLLVISFIWGTSYILIKVALQSVPPTWITFGRVSSGAVLMWLALLALRSALPERTRWRDFLVLGVLNNALPWWLYPLAQKTVSSSLTSVLNATQPLWGALIAVLLHDSSLGTRVGWGLALGFGGVILAVSGGLDNATATPLGVGLIFCATFSYAAGTAYAKCRLGGVAPLTLAVAQLSVAWVCLLPLAASSGVPPIPKLEGALAVVALGVFASGVASLLYFDLLRRVSSPTQVLVVAYLIPIWGLLWGALAGEHIGWEALAGVAVILVGVWLINTPATRSAPRSRWPW